MHSDCCKFPDVDWNPLAFMEFFVVLAFVAGWLPGTEAGGIADLLFRPAPGGTAYDFTGRLSFAWPGTGCDASGTAAQFRRGYGLSYSRPVRMGSLPVRASDGQPCSR